jgi:hypothetical protein
MRRGIIRTSSVSVARNDDALINIASADLFTLLDAATQSAHQAEGADYRPVSSPFADINLYDQIRQYQNPQIDVWTVQIYRYVSIQDLL